MASASPFKEAGYRGPEDHLRHRRPFAALLQHTLSQQRWNATGRIGET